MFGSHKRTIVLVLIATAFTLSPLSATPPNGKGGGKGAIYTVTALHTPMGIFPPKGISAPNADGVVSIVGDVAVNQAILWEVSTNGDILQSTPLAFNPYDVSSEGLVVGTEHRDWTPESRPEAGGGILQEVAVAWKMGSLVDLPLLVGDESAAVGINAFRQIVGREASYDPQTGEKFLTGVYWELDADGNILAVVPLGDFLPSRISDAGYIAGTIFGLNVPAIADVDADGVVTVTSLGLPADATEAYAYDIDHMSRVVGSYSNATETRAFRWSVENGYEDLGALHKKSTFTVGYGIGADGMVVGQSLAARERVFYSDLHAFVWDGSEMQDLNDLIPAKSGVDFLFSAGGINSVGQIICLGSNENTGWTAYLLSPAP